MMSLKLKISIIFITFSFSYYSNNLISAAARVNPKQEATPLVNLIPSEALLTFKNATDLSLDAKVRKENEISWIKYLSIDPNNIKKLSAEHRDLLQCAIAFASTKWVRKLIEHGIEFGTDHIMFAFAIRATLLREAAFLKQEIESFNAFEAAHSYQHFARMLYFKEQIDILDKKEKYLDLIIKFLKDQVEHGIQHKRANGKYAYPLILPFKSPELKKATMFPKLF